jgi:hypothetical protein
LHHSQMHLLQPSVIKLSRRFPKPAEARASASFRNRWARWWRRSVFASVFEVSIVFDLRRASLRASLEPEAVFS